MKKVILFLLLLAMPVFGAAQICTWDNVGGDNNWHNAANWATTVEADRVPLTGDSVVFNNIVNDNCFLTSDSAANMTDLTMTGYTGILAMATNNLDFDGDVVLDGMITASIGAVLYCSGDFTKTTSMSILPSALTVRLDGTGNVVCNSVTGGTLIVNTSGTHTAADAGLWDSFDIDSGTYADGDFDHDIAGTIRRDGGTLTLTGTWTMSAAGTLKQSVSGQAFDIVIDDVATLSGIVYLSSLGGSGTITGDNVTNRITISGPGGDNFYTFSGTHNCKMTMTLAAGSSRTLNQGITLGGYDLLVFRGHLTVGGNVDLGAGDLGLYGATSGTIGIDLATHNLTCNDIIVGQAAFTISLDLGTGTHTVTGDISRTAGTCSLEFGTSVTTLSAGKTLDGTSITCTAGATPRISGGTVSNVDLSASSYLDARGVDSGSVLDGGGNSNVRFARGLLGGGVM